MRRLVTFVLTLLLASPLFAQTGGSRVVGLGAGGGGSTSIGTGTALSGCTSSILTASAASLLACDPASIVNGSVSTAGRSILTIKDTITGASATSNFLNVTGSFNSTLSATTRGAMLSFTGDNDSQIQEGLNVSFAGGGSNSATRSISSIMTGTHVNGPSYAVYGDNASVGASGWSMGVAGIGAVNTAAKYALGVLGLGSTINQAGTYATGGWFTGGGSAATTNIIGVAGGAYSGGTNGIGGLFYLNSTAGMDPVNNYVGSYTTVTGKAALIADNGAVAANIFEARDNGTAVFTIADGGSVQLGADGTASLPQFGFAADMDASGTGFYRPAANFINFTANGTVQFRLGSYFGVENLVRLGSGAQINWADNASSGGGTEDSGLTRLAAGVIGATLGTTSSNGWIRNSAGEIALNADYTNATATFSSTALSVTVISGRTYNFSMNLTFADSTAADGAQFDFNGGSAAATNFRVHCMSTNAAGAILAQSNAAATALATANAVTLALTTQANLVCNGTFVPSGNGTFIVRAAQSAHTSGTLTVHRGSWLSVKDARPL